MARFLRRQVTYQLRPPVVLASAAAPPFIAEPIRAQSAPPVRTRTRSQLGPPAAVFSAYTPFGPDTTRAPQPRQGRQPHYRLSPPAVVGQFAAPFLASAPKTVYATAVRRSRHRPFVRSTLRPAVVAPTVVVFTAPAERVAFRVSVRRATEQHFVSSTIYPPEIITPLPAAPSLTRKLVRSPRQGRVVKSVLFEPATLEPAVVVVVPPPPTPEPRWSPFIDSRGVRRGEYDPSHVQPRLEPRRRGPTRGRW